MGTTLIDAQLVLRDLVDTLGIESLLGAHPQSDFNPSSLQYEELNQIAATFHRLQLILFFRNRTDRAMELFAKLLTADNLSGQGDNERSWCFSQEAADSFTNLNHSDDQQSCQVLGRQATWRFDSKRNVVNERVAISLLYHSPVGTFVHWMHNSHVIRPSHLCGSGGRGKRRGYIDVVTTIYRRGIAAVVGSQNIANPLQRLGHQSRRIGKNGVVICIRFQSDAAFQ